jgi:hypothetical protein
LRRWPSYAVAAFFAALVALAFARFATSAALRSGDSFLFAAAFVVAGFTAVDFFRDDEAEMRKHVHPNWKRVLSRW